MKQLLPPRQKASPRKFAWVFLPGVPRRVRTIWIQITMVRSWFTSMAMESLIDWSEPRRGSVVLRKSNRVHWERAGQTIFQSASLAIQLKGHTLARIPPLEFAGTVTKRIL